MATKRTSPDEQTNEDSDCELLLEIFN